MHTDKMETESSNLLNNAKESMKNPSSRLTKGYRYKETEIWIRGNEDKWCATIGNLRITNIEDTEEKILKILGKPTMELIMSIIATMIDLYDDMKTQGKELIRQVEEAK